MQIRIFWLSDVGSTRYVQSEPHQASSGGSSADVASSRRCSSTSISACKAKNVHTARKS